MLFTVKKIMKNWLTNKWAFIRYSTTRGWWHSGAGVGPRQLIDINITFP